MASTSYAGKVNAPDFPQGLDWFNTDRPISLHDLRGRIVLLDFWTSCCINCMHVIPELKKLEEKYRDELVVIGVHSAKFAAERDPASIRDAIRRYRIEHPVVNDHDFRIWNSYAARAWPTFMLIDPEGKVVGTHSGENIFEIFDEAIAGMIAEFDARQKLLRGPLPFSPEPGGREETLLSFPGKIAIDPSGHTLYIADSGHHRIVIVSLANECVVDVIGDGHAGFHDGAYGDARFNNPQGLALDGTTLYVADTDNHAIRKVDLRARSTRTIAGIGRQARELNVAGYGPSIPLNSPWDLALHQGILYIAMAGAHQIWRLDPLTLDVRPHAGSGREDLIDGALASAALAQPSGITAADDRLYIADSEVSAIRSVDTDPAGEVRALVGEGLFEFGDQDGIGGDVRLQHPLGVLHHEGMLYVADSYNNRIKMLNPVARRATTLVGSGGKGRRDGEAAAELNEPSGLAWGNGMLYIADTSNHAIRRFDFATGRLSTLRIRGAAPRVRPEEISAVSHDAEEESVYLDEAAVFPGEGTILLTLRLPEGCVLNEEAPLRCTVITSDFDVAAVERPDMVIERPAFPLRIPVRFSEGRALLTFDIACYYCRNDEAGLCMAGELRALLPLEVTPAAEMSELEVEAPLAGVEQSSGV